MAAPRTNRFALMPQSIWFRIERNSSPVRFVNLFDQARGGESAHERQDANLGAVRREDGPFARVERFGPVVATFDVDVRADRREEPVRALFPEDDNGVHASQSGENGGALFLWYERTMRAFEFTRGTVGIEADDEQVTEFFGALQIADVTEVKEVETTVGGDDAPPSTMGGGGPTSGLRES